MGNKRFNEKSDTAFATFITTFAIASLSVLLALTIAGLNTTNNTTIDTCPEARYCDGNWNNGEYVCDEYFQNMTPSYNITCNISGEQGYRNSNETGILSIEACRECHNWVFSDSSNDMCNELCNIKSTYGGCLAYMSKYYGSGVPEKLCGTVIPLGGTGVKTNITKSIVCPKWDSNNLNINNEIIECNGVIITPRQFDIANAVVKCDIQNYDNWQDITTCKKEHVAYDFTEQGKTLELR